MASPSGKRRGLKCDGAIKKGARTGQTCGMLLLAKDSPGDAFPSTACPKCGKHHPILALLCKAIEMGELTKEAIIAAISEPAEEKTEKRREEMTKNTETKPAFSNKWGVSIRVRRLERSEGGGTLGGGSITLWIPLGRGDEFGERDHSAWWRAASMELILSEKKAVECGIHRGIFHLDDFNQQKIDALIKQTSGRVELVEIYKLLGLEPKAPTYQLEFSF